MSWPVVVLISIAVLFATAVEVVRHYRMRPYLRRPCAGIRWHRRFPEVQHDEIRAFLRLFTDAFGFLDKHRSVFRPDDRPMEIFGALNPDHFSVDADELEILAEEFEGAYGVKLEKVWRDDITLGELFELSRRSKSNAV